MWYYTGIIFFLLISGIVFLIYLLFRIKKRANVLDLLNRLHLAQYRYQCNPHTLLNQINSLAALPTRVSSSEMQARLLEFGRGLRHALTYTANLTSAVNTQLEQVNEYVALINRNNSSAVEIRSTTETVTAGWLPLPSLLLMNLVNLIVKSRSVDLTMQIHIHVTDVHKELVVTISADNMAEAYSPGGISDELLRLQLELFNHYSDGSLVITGFQPNENGNPVQIRYIESKYVKNYSEAS